MGLRKKLTPTTCPSSQGGHHYILPPAHDAVEGMIVGKCRECGQQSHKMLASLPVSDDPSVFSVNSNEPLRRIKK